MCLIFYFLDIIAWKLVASDNFTDFAMEYAEAGHYFYSHEIAYAGTIIIIAGTLFLLFALRHIKNVIIATNTY